MRIIGLCLALFLACPVWAQPGPPPRGLSVSQPAGALGQSQLNLHWDPVVGAVGYEVLRKVKGRWWLNEDDPNCTPMTNSTSITGLAPSSDFEFCVRSVFSAGVSLNGELVKARTADVGTIEARRVGDAPLKLPEITEVDKGPAGMKNATDPESIPEGASIIQLLPPSNPRRTSNTDSARDTFKHSDSVATSGGAIASGPPAAKAKERRERAKGPPPPVPEGLMGLYSSQSEIRLSWRSVAEATGYQVEEEKDGQWVLLDDGIIEGNRPAFVLQNRSAGPYLFRIRSVRHGVRSSYSLPIKVER